MSFSQPAQAPVKDDRRLREEVEAVAKETVKGPDRPLFTLSFQARFVRMCCKTLLRHMFACVPDPMESGPVSACTGAGSGSFILCIPAGFRRRHDSVRDVGNALPLPRF